MLRALLQGDGVGKGSAPGVRHWGLNAGKSKLLLGGVRGSSLCEPDEGVPGAGEESVADIARGCLAERGERITSSGGDRGEVCFELRLCNKLLISLSSSISIHLRRRRIPPD